MIKLIPNYIPHKKPIVPNFYRWKKYFNEDLEILYYTMINILKKRHDNDFELSFNDFCIFIFKNSSKYIPNY